MNSNNSLGDFLKKLRGFNSLRTISTKIEMKINNKFTHTKLDNIEKGKTQPSFEDLKILAEIYSYSYENLLKIASGQTEDESNKVEKLFDEYKKLSSDEKEKFLKLINIK